MPLTGAVFAGLSTAARKSIVRGLIPEFLRQGYTATGALNFLKTFKAGIRRQTWLDQWREVAGAEKLSKTYRFIPKKYKVAGNLIAPTAEPMKRQYKYNFQVAGIDLQTGEPTTKWFSFLDDARYSPDEAEEIMKKWLDAEADNYEWMYDFEMDVPSTELYIMYRSR